MSPLSNLPLQKPEPPDAWYRYLWYGFLIFNVIVLLRTGIYYGGFLRGSDGQLYYATARSLLFDRDLDFTNEFGALTPYPVFLDQEVIQLTPAGRPGNKYPIGFGITAVPALIVGQYLTVFARAILRLPYELNGYEVPYQLCVALGQLLLAFWGAHLLWRFLKEYFPSGLSFIAVMSIWFGTSLFYYSAIFPFMSHAVGFFCISALLYMTSKISDETSMFDLILIGLVAGLGIITRPTNAILYLPIAAIFFIKTSGLTSGMRLGKVSVIGIATLGMCMLQLLAWQSIYGSWMVYTYGNEGFRWLEPELTKTLFSSNHGLVFFAPIVTAGVVGLLLALLDIELLGIGAAMLLSIMLMTHTNAAWHAWWFGHGYGARAFTELGPYFAFGITQLFGRVIRSSAAAILTCVILVSWSVLLLLLFLTERIPLVGEFSILKVLGGLLGG